MEISGHNKIIVLRKSLRRRTGPVVFSIMKYESYHLPFFLDHYRDLGVSNFLIYNDSSSDGTTELLLSQDDVTVITSDIPYGAVIEGERWVSVLKRTVPNSLIKKGWAIIADADEYLFLPSDFENIIELVGYMEGQDNICASASLVDFYPERLAKRLYPRNLPPQSQCRYFDKGKLFDWTPGESKPQPRFSGVRARLHRLLKQNHEEEYNRIFEAERTGLAKSWKVPLLRCGTNAVLLNQHDGAMAPPDNIRLTLGYYKFTPDLDSKIFDAPSSETHHSDSVEYDFLKSALQHFEDLSLLGPESVEFEDVSSLESAGHVFLN